MALFKAFFAENPALMPPASGESTGGLHERPQDKSEAVLGG